MKKLSDRTKFDKRWEDVFNDAELAPSEGVWDKIDSALSKEEAGYFKKRAFLFKMLAAASVAFALGVGLFSINYYLDQNTEQVAIQIDGQNDNLDLLKKESDLAAEKNIEHAAQKGIDDQEPEEQLLQAVVIAESENNEVKVIYDEPVAVVPLDNKDDISLNKFTSIDASREYFSLNEIHGQGISMSSSEEMIYKIDHIYLIPIMPEGASKVKKDKESGIFLAGLDFSTGVFDPNFQTDAGGFNNASSSFARDGAAVYSNAMVESINDQYAAFNTMNKSFAVVRGSGKKPEPKIAFSYGANIGFKLTRRVIVQTGIAYRRANTTSTTTGYIEDSNSDSRIPIISTYQYQFDGLTKVNLISETNLNNQYEFLSIPLRAGYMIVDRKVNLSLMAGISSEFFLNNQIEDGSEYLATLTNSPGDGSPYKGIYFNGSLGTVLGYNFFRNYSITVEPSYRFALNSFTRDDYYLNSLPSSFMLSFGVAYNF